MGNFAFFREKRNENSNISRKINHKKPYLSPPPLSGRPSLNAIHVFLDMSCGLVRIMLLKSSNSESPRSHTLLPYPVSRLASIYNIHTMNYPQKTGFNLYQLRNCAYITYSVKTWFFKILSVPYRYKICIMYSLYRRRRREVGVWRENTKAPRNAKTKNLCSCLLFPFLIFTFSVIIVICLG